MCSFQFMTSTINLNKGVNYSDTDILLDICSTTSVFNNKKMLLNVGRSKKTLRAYLNGGYQESNLEGDIPGMIRYGTILSPCSTSCHLRTTEKIPCNYGYKCGEHR